MRFKLEPPSNALSDRLVERLVERHVEGLVEVSAGFACDVAVGPAACRASGMPPS